MIKITGVSLLGAMVLAVAGSLMFSGCSKDSASWFGSAPREVEVTLPALAVADAVLVEPMGSRALTAAYSTFPRSLSGYTLHPIGSHVQPYGRGKKGENDDE